MVSVTFAIIVKDELEEIKQLIPLIEKNMEPQDEIVVLVDDRCPEEVWNYLSEKSCITTCTKEKFNNDFSEWKNKLNNYCNKDYIFNIDADEQPSEILFQNLHLILELNPDTEAYWLVRENYVEGLTQEWIQKWRWNVDDGGRINYPDSQLRIFKNESDRIKWQNKVHEQLIGYKSISSLPEEYCLIHKKSLERQIKQNNFYQTL